MKKIACNTGLVMTEVQEVTGVNHGSVGQWLTAAVLMVGLTGLLVPVFPSISYGIILTAVVEVLLCWIVLFLAARERERQELILIPFLIYAIICFGRIRDGIFCLANDVLELLTARTGRIHLHYEVQSTGNIGFAVWSVGFLLAFLTGRRDSEAGSRSSTVRGRANSSSDPAGAETDNEDGTCRAHCLWRLEHCAGIGADRNCCIGRRWSKYRLSTVETVVSPAGV